MHGSFVLANRLCKCSVLACGFINQHAAVSLPKDSVLIIAEPARVCMVCMDGFARMRAHVGVYRSARMRARVYGF